MRQGGFQIDDTNSDSDRLRSIHIEHQFEAFFSVGYGSLRSASFAKIATLNAIEIAKCADERSGSFCIKNYEKRLRDLDLGSSGGIFNSF